LNINIKLHKDTAPIRPIVNYKNSPSYYIAKITADWLKRNSELPFEYNIKNPRECAANIKELNTQPIHKMTTLDITNVNTNIPINEKIELITTKIKYKTNFDDITQNEIIELIKTTTSQNYFEFNNIIW
jgi:hypothetical protein